MTGRFGLAVDVGTTTMALELVELATGQVMSSTSLPNPQLRFGADIMTRIAFAQAAPANGEALHATLVRALNALVIDLVKDTGISISQICEAVFVGNATMMHTLLGLDPTPLGVTPYRGVLEAGWQGRAPEVGLELPQATLRVPPGIRSHVGADTAAAILATGFDELAGPALLIDLGTNSEVVLAHAGRLLCTSTAAGPAFESTDIQNRVQGSQLIGLVAERLRTGAIDASGRVTQPDPAVGQEAVRQLQLAKAGVAAGIRILLERAGLQALQLESIVLAGAFGTYLDAQDALRIGLLPDVPVERVRSAGTAALAGARLLLTRAEAYARAAAVAARARYVELGGHQRYGAAFIEEIAFPAARGRLLSTLSHLTTAMKQQARHRCPYRAKLDVCTFRGPCRNRVRVRPGCSRCGGGPLNDQPV